MAKKILLFFIFLSSLFLCCTNQTSPSNPPSIVGKWYYDINDDRNYYQFFENGKAYQHYYNPGSFYDFNQHQIITNNGEWEYINKEQTTVSIKWDYYKAKWYDIVEETDEKLILKENPDGPSGKGLENNTTLLKKANKIVYTIPEEISNLIGTWYYDDSKDGKYLEFNIDGHCYYHYYQDYSSGTFSSLNGWVTNIGIWTYSTENKTISITMKDSIAYTYSFEILTPEIMKLVLTKNNPSGVSHFHNDGLFYK